MIFYKSFYDGIEQMPEDEQLAAYKMIFEYAFNDIQMPYDGLANVVFHLVKPQIDANRKRRSDGEKGGRPKKETIGFEEKKPVVSKMEKTEKPNVNENVNVNANANVKKRLAPDDASPCAGRFLLNDATEYAVSENDVVTYQQLYPGIDVRQELRNIEAWCLSNPKNRKTRNGAKRFLNAWLSRAQNSARVEKPAPKKNGFNNFNQRQYDYTDLERKLLTAGHGGESSGS